MAHFRLGVVTYSRGDSSALRHAAYRSGERLQEVDATTLAAYRAGAKLDNRRTGAVHDFRRRRGVGECWIQLPAGAPTWARDRASLWSMADAAEKRCDARIAREVLISLPHELSAAGRSKIVHELAAWLVERHGVAVDCAIHDPPRKGDERHHHAHLLCSTRRLEAEGFGRKTRELDDRKTGPKAVAEIRAKACDVINAELAREGLEVRVDHRSGRRQAVAVRAQQRRDVEVKVAKIPGLSARDRGIRVAAEHAWREEDRARRLAQDPRVQDLETRVLAAEKEQLEVKAAVAAKVLALEEKIGRKASRREVGVIRRQVQQQRQAKLKRRYPTGILTGVELQRLQAAKALDDLKAKIAKPDRIAALEDQIRDRNDPPQVRIAALAARFRQAAQRDPGLSR